MNRKGCIILNFTMKNMKPSCTMNNVMLTCGYLRKTGVCVDPLTVRKGLELCPAVFVDNHELPSHYSIEDLEYTMP